MAGRSSTTIDAGKAQKIFTNTTGSPVVVAINAISADSTKNPKCSIVIDQESNHLLNFNTVTHTLPQDITWATGDFDLMGDPVGSSSLGMYVGSDKNQMTYNGSSFSRITNSAGMRYSCYDPYFFDNPKAYNKETAYGGINPENNNIYFHTDLAEDKSFFLDWLQNNYATSGTTYIDGVALSYGNRATLCDVWTDVYMGVQSNGYMSAGHFFDHSGSNVSRATQNRSSDSFFYTRGVTSSNDWDTHQDYIDDGLSLSWQCDGGVFATGVTENPQADFNWRISLISARHWRANASYVAGANSILNAKDGTTNQAENDLINYGQVYHARLTTNVNGGYLCSWIKYNPTTDRYYLNMQGIATEKKGIWSFAHDDVFVSGDSYTQFDSVCQKEVATHDLTQKTTQPMRIGASLWVCFTGNNLGDGLYSTDLINWKTAAEYMGIDEPIALGSDNDKQATRFMIAGSQNANKVFEINSGFSSIPQAGLLENGLGVGTFERNGLVLDIGDSLYLENQDASTSIYSTVTFVEV